VPSWALFEAGKLTSFASCTAIQNAQSRLLTVGLVLMGSNVAGVKRYAVQRLWVDGSPERPAYPAATITTAEITDIRKQLDAGGIPSWPRPEWPHQGRDDKAPSTATAIVDKAQIERDRIAGKLREALRPRRRPADASKQRRFCSRRVRCPGARNHPSTGMSSLPASLPF